MPTPVALFAALLLPVSSLLSQHVTAATVQVAVPATPPSSHVVQQNFLGVSFELSFVDEYFGNDTASIPPTVVNYLSTLRSRIGNNSLKLRIGGNSMDTSKYISTQTSPMIQRVDSMVNADNQPVNYGPVLWDVLDKVSSDVGGASYLIGLSLIDPEDPTMPTVAGDASKKLGSSLDGFLLGNEPDLYQPHGFRASQPMYSPFNYINEFKTASDRLINTTGGNVLEKHDLGGPTICCNWDLDTIINDGYISKFGSILEYISLQHYPQNNCFGSYMYQAPYYTNHANVVQLASWQKTGIDMAVSNKENVIMSEFNSASCGGIKGISDTFGVGSLWTVDYALQLASVGYSSAYLHTRERGISYNLFAPPDGPIGTSGSWTTNPPFYGLLVTAEALNSKNGSIVADLNLGGVGSNNNTGITYSGYAVYDAGDKTVSQLVFFNAASDKQNQTFQIPANTFSATTASTVVVKYLVADSMSEASNIGWGGETFAGAGDGKPVASTASWAPSNTKLDCTKGCSVTIPAPGMAVVFADGAPANKPAAAGSGSSTTASGKSGSLSNFTQDYFIFSIAIYAAIGLLWTSLT